MNRTKKIYISIKITNRFRRKLCTRKKGEKKYRDPNMRGIIGFKTNRF